MGLKFFDIRLYEGEIDIILQALMDFNYGINSKYDFRKESLTDDEEKEKFIARNLYEHILCAKFSNRNK